MIAHNGEINTVRGNPNWMAARQGELRSELLGDVSQLLPVNLAASDSASFDEVLELLHLSGRSLPHAVRMMIPEAWEQNEHMDPALRAFYEFHSNMMEPWDGPASMTFTDGVQVGSVLDRNGLRPGRFWVTDDGSPFSEKLATLIRAQGRAVRVVDPGTAGDAARAAEIDAERRLAVTLADQIVQRPIHHIAKCHLGMAEPGRVCGEPDVTERPCPCLHPAPAH